MSGWSILFGVMALLLLLLLMPVTVRIIYDEQLKLRAYYGCIPIYRYPSKRPQKPKPEKAEKAKKAEKGDKAPNALAKGLEETLKEQGVAGAAAYLRDIAHLTGTIFRHLLAAIVVDRQEMQIVVATGDAAETALLYGRLCGVIYPAQALIERYVRIRRRQIEVAPNFTLEQGYVKGAVTFHVIPLRLLVAILIFAAAWIWKYNNPKIKETAKHG